MATERTDGRRQRGDKTRRTVAAQAAALASVDGLSGMTLAQLATVTHNCKAGTNATSFSWAFGDGTGASGTLTPTRTYTAQGTYTVLLAASDSQGHPLRNDQPQSPQWAAACCAIFM